MILLLDTSTMTCRLTLIDGDIRHDDAWEANRELAKGLLKYLHDQLATYGRNWSDITSIGVLRGPGSFTGLRIGMTVLNTLAESLHAPIVGATGEQWQEIVLQRLKAGENDHIVLPEYGSAAHITQPRK